MGNFRKNEKLFDGIVCLLVIGLFFLFKYSFGWNYFTIFLIYGIFYLILGTVLFLVYKVKRDLLYILSGITCIFIIYYIYFVGSI
jgi:hypothetical protein